MHAHVEDRPANGAGAPAVSEFAVSGRPDYSLAPSLAPNAGTAAPGRVHLEPFYASDYFDQLYNFAVELIKNNLAYVDDSTAEEIAAQKGTPTEPGTPSS